MHIVITTDSTESRFIRSNHPKINSYHDDVSQAIKKALENNGFEASVLRVDGNLREILADIHPDFAFNCSNFSQENKNYAFSPHVLKETGIPYTGSGEEACNNAYDKEKAKRIFISAGIRTPRSMVVSQSLNQIKDWKKFPVFVKPVKGGCSFGISKDSLIKDRKSMLEKLPKLIKQFNQTLLVEEYLPGREFTVGVLGNKKLRVLPIMEFKRNSEDQLPYRSYNLKMIQSEREDVCCPAKLEPDQQMEIEEMARKSFRALGCRDYARVDLRLDNHGRPFVLEINALPNLMPKSSSYAIMAEKGGLIFNTLIRTIMSLAGDRYKQVSLP